MWSSIEVPVESDDPGSESGVSIAASSKPIGFNEGTSSFAAAYMRARTVYN